MEKNEPKKPVSTTAQDDDFTNRLQNTIEKFQKLQATKQPNKPSNTDGSFLGLGDMSLRKSASYQDITELPKEGPIEDLGRRGSLPQSLPASPQANRARGRPARPWQLRRSSTPVPGSLDVSSILIKARKRFTSHVGNSCVKENDEVQD